MYYIMDERAHHNPDAALILEVCDELCTLEQARAIRDRDWPGQCIVNTETWEVEGGPASKSK